MACLASTGAAGCAACGAEENWDASAASFLEGKSIENTPAPKWGPSAAREENSQFSSNETEEAAKNASEEPSSPVQKPKKSIVLEDAIAEPTTVAPGSPVKITAVLGDKMTAYAIIRNFADVQVGNVTLEQTSGNEYVGTWTASIATGTYKASIEAYGSGASKTFNDVLQIEVTDSNSNSTSSAASRFKRLG
ncbi:MAG TPA: hypothetical protein VLB04_08830 [Methanotrichaceae archaeon]|nr:hypothetical protein [Methanotrichaceae archaeon]